MDAPPQMPDLTETLPARSMQRFVGPLGDKMKTYIITTDAAWFLNGNTCGWAAIVEHEDGIYSKSGVGHKVESSGAAELLAVVAALGLFSEPSRILIRTDSQYVLGLYGNLNAWKLKGWKRTKRHMMENYELLHTLWAMCKRHQVSFQHVKGHDRDLHNLRADKMAFLARFPGLDAF